MQSEVRFLRKCTKAMAECGMEVMQNRGTGCNPCGLDAQHGIAWPLLTVISASIVVLEGGLRLSSP